MSPTFPFRPSKRRHQQHNRWWLWVWQLAPHGGPHTVIFGSVLAAAATSLCRPAIPPTNGGHALADSLATGARRIAAQTGATPDSSEPVPVPMPPYAGDPQEDEATIRELLRHSGAWTEWRYRQPGTTVRVYVRPREFHADLVVVWTLAYAGACRVVVTADEDPLAAEFAMWHWVGRAVDAFKQICGLTLPPQGGADLQPLPVACRPPTTRPVILRLPQ